MEFPFLIHPKRTKSCSGTSESQSFGACSAELQSLCRSARYIPSRRSQKEGVAPSVADKQLAQSSSSGSTPWMRRETLTTSLCARSASSVTATCLSCNRSSTVAPGGFAQFGSNVFIGLILGVQGNHLDSTDSTPIDTTIRHQAWYVMTRYDCKPMGVAKLNEVAVLTLVDAGTWSASQDVSNGICSADIRHTSLESVRHTWGQRLGCIDLICALVAQLLRREADFQGSNKSFCMRRS